MAFFLCQQFSATQQKMDGCLVQYGRIGLCPVFHDGIRNRQRMPEKGIVIRVFPCVGDQCHLGIDDSGDDYSFGYGDAAFSNLDLEVWYYDAAADAYSAVALSDSLYNSVEHLSFALEAAGQYFLRVVFDEMIYGDLLGDAETFALVWNLAAIPEAAEFAAMFGLLALMLALYGKRR